MAPPAWPRRLLAPSAVPREPLSFINGLPFGVVAALRCGREAGCRGGRGRADVWTTTRYATAFGSWADSAVSARRQVEHRRLHRHRPRSRAPRRRPHVPHPGLRLRGRFGIEASPKFWVKWALDLDSGRPKLLKFPFQEAFSMRIGALRVPCFRDPEKEGRVLRLVRGDRRFMQGRTVTDDDGHAVTSWTSCRDRTCTTSSGRPHALTVSTSSASCRACCAACATRWTRWPG